MNPLMLLAQAGGEVAEKTTESLDEVVEKFPFGIDPEIFPEFLQGTFLGIQYWQYLGAFLCILLGLVGKKVCEFIFEHYIIPTAKKTRVKFDHLLSEAVYKPAALGLALLGLWGAIVFFHLPVEPTNLRKLATSVLKILLAMDFMWFVFRLVDVLAVYLIGAAEKTESKLDDQLVPIIKKSLKAFVAVLVFVLVVQNLGYSVGSLLAGLGIGGLAMALAAKDTVANLFGGIVIFTDRPFRVGDWVRIGDVEGTIEQIGFRSTRIRTFPKTLITLPNSLVANSVIDNKQQMPMRRIRSVVGVTYETTAEQMEALLEDFKKILAAEGLIDDETSLVRFVEFGSSSLDIRLQYFTQPISFAEHSVVVERVNLAVMRAVEARGLSIAFPTRTVYFEGDVAKALAAGSKPTTPSA